MTETFTVENVAREELKRGLADGTIRLVDVREPNEYADGHIPGAILNPLQSFDPDALPKPEEGKRVVLSCRSGKRSLVALERARDAGPHRPGRPLRRRHARLERSRRAC